VASHRAFAIADPTVWNSLLDELEDMAHVSDSFKQLLKTIFSFYVTSALEVFLNDMCYINSRFTYLLPYLILTY